MKKTWPAFSLFLFWLLLGSQASFLWSQQDTNTQQPVLWSETFDHDFGRVREVHGYSVHQFDIRNTGTAPLIISHVLTTCGCAQPEWSKEPIEPGEKGFVIVSYDMVNRPGPFEKKITAFTNERRLRHTFTIKGVVIPKPQILDVLFHDTIGTVQMEQASFHFNTVRPREMKTTEIWIQNYSEEDLRLTVDNIPDFLTVTVPDLLESNYPDRLIVEIHPSKVDENFRGRKFDHFSWTTESVSGEKVTQTIPVSANFIDDFRRITPAERAESPSAQLSAQSLDYGKLKKKRVQKELSISNTGKSALSLHSISIDNTQFIEITGFNKKVLQPDETLKLKVYVNPKDLKGSLTTDLYVITNDPQRPLQEVQLTAEK